MARPSKHDGVVYRRNDSNIWWMRYRDRSGCRRLESTHTEDWQEAQRQLRERLQARDNNTLHIVRKGEQLAFGEWADFFLENYSKPPIRAASTHEANENALKSLRPVFGPMKMTEIDATQIEIHLRNRLKHRRHVRRKEGIAELGLLKPATVHQEFRILRRIFSVAVKKKLCPANPCAGVEFPVILKGLFRPHYMTWSEQQAIESHAPVYLRNVIRILTETGLRVYKELAPLRKEQVDLSEQAGVHRRFEDPNRGCRSASDGYRRRSIPEPDGGRWSRAVALSKFEKPNRVSDELQEDLGDEPCGRLVYPTSGCTTSGPHTLLGSVRVASRTNGSRSSFGKLMRRCSRSTPR